jgi:hypothetical protein
MAEATICQSPLGLTRYTQSAYELTAKEETRILQWFGLLQVECDNCLQTQTTLSGKRTRSRCSLSRLQVYAGLECTKCAEEGATCTGSQVTLLVKHGLIASGTSGGQKPVKCSNCSVGGSCRPTGWGRCVGCTGKNKSCKGSFLLDSIQEALANQDRPLDQYWYRKSNSLAIFQEDHSNIVKPLKGKGSVELSTQADYLISTLIRDKTWENDEERCRDALRRFR